MMEMQEINPELASALIRSRRSVYPNMFSGDKVPEAIIEEMLENANWAPTHKLTEPWRFVIFEGMGLQRLSDFQSSLYKKLHEARGDFDKGKFEKLKAKPLQCSHVIAIAMERDPKERVPEIEEIEAVAAAAQNMYLTAAAHKVGCYWGSGGITYEEEAKPFFGLEPQDKLLGFLFVGMPKGKWPVGKRQSIEDKVHWVREA